jgi:putative nucleotidyltransferase with HDIG domain
MSETVDYKRKLSAVRELPVFPATARKILNLSDDDHKCVEKLTDLISRDQTLALKILALANSSFFGHRARIGTVRHAVMVIGTRMLKQFSLSVSVMSTLKRRDTNRPDFAKHSIATAMAASMIAKQIRNVDPDLSFMAGLVHDIGRVIIDMHFPGEPAIEHTEVGGWLAERWELPQPLVQAIRYHHSNLVEHLMEPMIATVHGADLCAKAVLDPNPPEIAPEVREALRYMGADLHDIQRELRKHQKQIDNLVL